MQGLRWDGYHLAKKTHLLVLLLENWSVNRLKSSQNQTLSDSYGDMILRE